MDTGTVLWPNRIQIRYTWHVPYINGRMQTLKQENVSVLLQDYTSNFLIWA